MCRGLRFTFDVEPAEFVQILHTGTDHWVMVFSIDCAPGEIHIYNSLSLTPAKDLEAQIAALIHTPQKTITIRYAQPCLLHSCVRCVITFPARCMATQRQEGTFDCGLSALALPSHWHQHSNMPHSILSRRE